MTKLSEKTTLSFPLVGALMATVAGGAIWCGSVNRDIQDLKNSMARVENKLGTMPRKEIAHEPAQIGPQKELASSWRDRLRVPDVWAGPR